MRKQVLTTLALAAMLPVSAQEAYSFLTIETTDGAKTNLSVETLTMSVGDGVLTVGDQSFPLANLKKMYFSDGNVITGIDQLTTDGGNEIVAIYDLQGRKVSKDDMQNGIFVVKTKQKTTKMIVK